MGHHRGRLPGAAHLGRSVSDSTSPGSSETFGPAGRPANLTGGDMVKRGLLILMLAVAAASCDDNNSPTAPADPNIVVFTAQLSGANEVPPIDDVEKDARGNVRITVNLTRDASNNINGATYNFVVNLNSFTTVSLQ